MERRDEDSKNNTSFQKFDVSTTYILLNVTCNLLFGSLFYYYSINTLNDECQLLRQVSLLFVLYSSISIILAIITIIGQQTFNIITIGEGIIRLLFLIAFLIATIISKSCYHLQVLSIIFLLIHINVFIIACMKSQINKTKQL